MANCAYGGAIPEPGDPIPLGEFYLEERRFPAVYFLYCDGVVVYVGQSRTLTFRINQHLEEGAKVFDAVAFVRCPFNRLTEIEGYYIRDMAPKYNACGLAKKTRERESWRLRKDRRTARKKIQFVPIEEIDPSDIKFVDAAECIVPPDEIGDFMSVGESDVAKWRDAGLLAGDMSIIDMFKFMMTFHREVRPAQDRFEKL